MNKNKKLVPMIPLNGWKPYELVVTFDKDFIKSRRTEIFELVVDSYKKIGGFKGADNPRSLVKNSDIGKFVFDENGQIVALALYRTDLTGKKRFCSATKQLDPFHIEAAKIIIQNDIEPYDNWYWVEASGKIEKLFKELNGNPIPNYLVEEVFKNTKTKITALSADGLHYARPIGDGDELEKMVFGFPSKEIFDATMKKIEDYKSFKEVTLSIGKDKFMESELSNAMYGLPNSRKRKIYNYCRFISLVFDVHCEDNVNELLISWAAWLSKCEKEIKNWLSKDSNDEALVKVCEAVLRRAQCLREDCTLLVPLKIDVRSLK